MFDIVFQYAVGNFNFGYVLSINIIAYALILICSKVRKKELTKLIKVILTILVSIIMFILYKLYTQIETDVLINSSILAPVAWDWIIKPICKLLKIDYNDRETEIVEES